MAKGDYRASEEQKGLLKAARKDGMGVNRKAGTNASAKGKQHGGLVNFSVVKLFPLFASERTDNRFV